ncbi:transglycosylase domain-containing protein [Hanstruepera ponticola]|uniref:transglycosylase domain-containing protein n=1 Tax=Hanstruepera ponticola TaxID=2042995 RepID=UPI000CF02CBC|nr:transglycosylase domain-containing protein [Hanstruepera ponticola]
MEKLRALFKKKWVKWPMILLVSAVLFLTLLYGLTYLGLFGKLPTQQDLSTLKQAEATQVLDSNQKLIGKYYIYDRQPLLYKDFPQHLIDALIATEDVRFYEHNGVDNRSLLRVFFKNILLHDESAGGGSTITLQLAKNLFGRQDYLAFGILINKFKESITAKRIESIYSKEDILTLYLNTVPFPDNTYGIESAAQKFFNKPANKLSLSEAATLVGTLKANNYYNPRISKTRSELRRNVVVNQMLKYDFIDQEQAEAIKQDSLVLDYHSFNHDMGLAPYFRAQVKKELIEKLKTIKKPNGEPYDIYRDGLIVHTTLDATMQLYAEEAMNDHLTKLQNEYEKSYGTRAPWRPESAIFKKSLQDLPIYKRLEESGLSEDAIQDSLSKPRDIEAFSWNDTKTEQLSVKDSLSHYLKFLNTGMLSIDPSTGAIKTYIGGIDYRFFKYDHVSQSERQVGSTFKPIVYTTAIEQGMKPCSYYDVKAITYTNYDNWTPTNSGQEEDENIKYNLEKALSHSINTIAVKVLNDVGISATIEQAQKMGIVKDLPQEPALALGVAEINLKTLTGAYASYVNKSKAVKPYTITKITDKAGIVIAEFEPQVSKEEAYSDYTRQVLLEMMKSTINQGTASRLRTTYRLNNAIAGKTGTTQDNKDGWFVGLTPKLVTVTWVGNDNYNIGFKTTGLGQGANSALPLFAKFYQKLNNDSKFKQITQSQFEKPSAEVLNDLDCKLEKEDNFFQRLFKSKKKKKEFKGN